MNKTSQLLLLVMLTCRADLFYSETPSAQQAAIPQPYWARSPAFIKVSVTQS
jgi:hypothetical protein